MQTPEEFAAELYEVVDFWDHSWKANDEGGSVAADLIRARDAEVAAKALREAASEVAYAVDWDDAPESVESWLHERADRIESEGGDR